MSRGVEAKIFQFFLIFFLLSGLDPSALKESDDHPSGRCVALRDDCAPSSRRARTLKCIRSVRRSRVNPVCAADAERPHRCDIHDVVKTQESRTRESQ